LAQAQHLGSGSQDVCARLFVHLPAMAIVDHLAEVFSAFTTGAEMDGRAFTKCMRDADLLDSKLSTTDVDLIFTKCKAAGKRKIDLATFRKALGLIATRKGCTEDEVIREVSQTAGPAYRSVADKTRSRGKGGKGPERLFYDKTSYTGTHRNGGPSTLGGTSIIGVEDLVNRDIILEAGVQRRKSIMERSSSTSSIALSQSTSQLGPERFYRDRSTYTGTHRHGGPSLVGSGSSAPKEPYADLSALVNRDHVQAVSSRQRRRTTAPRQDDALHRQKSSPKQAASPKRRPLSLYPAMAQSQPLPVLLGGRSVKESDKELKEGKMDKDQEDDQAASAMPVLSGRRQAYASLSAEKPMLDPLNTKAMPTLGRLPMHLTPGSAQLSPCTAFSPHEAMVPLTLSPLSHRSKPAQVPALVLTPANRFQSL